jgi:hypothetical protein
MTRYYRALLTTALLAGLAAPAFAQTPAPAAPAAPVAAAPEAAPDAAKPTQETAKPAVHKHHRTASRHKTASKAETTPPAAQKK